jgi:4-diphosphocytidyl-2-C-methyl-D-erythritol kinase
MLENPLTERASAKINLTLRVVGRRADGFHQLESLVAFASDVHDTVCLWRGSTGLVSFMGPFATRQLCNSPDGSTVGAALRALKAQGLTVEFETATIEKCIPLAAGLGGGSSDAAAILRLAQRLHSERAVEMNWPQVALTVGADVPVCLVSKASVMSGIGETVVTLSTFPACYLVLANALERVPENKTASVFKRLAALNVGADGEADVTPPHLSSFTDLVAYLKSGGNDLENAAAQVMDSVSGIQAEMAAQPGCAVARMTGAGPTVFGLFERQGEAEAAMARLRQRHPHWWVQKTALQ